MNLNRVTLIGRLGKDPELKVMTNFSVCNFTLATTMTWMKEGQKQSKTEWHDITLFGKLGENANKYLSKGKLVYVEGRLETQEYKNKEGQTVRRKLVIASDLLFLEKMSNVAPSPSPELDKAMQEAAKVFSDNSNNMDEIPF